MFGKADRLGHATHPPDEVDPVPSIAAQEPPARRAGGTDDGSYTKLPHYHEIFKYVASAFGNPHCVSKTIDSTFSAKINSFIYVNLNHDNDNRQWKFSETDQGGSKVLPDRHEIDHRNVN